MSENMKGFEWLERTPCTVGDGGTGHVRAYRRTAFNESRVWQLQLLVIRATLRYLLTWTLEAEPSQVVKDAVSEMGQSFRPEASRPRAQATSSAPESRQGGR